MCALNTLTPLIFETTFWRNRGTIDVTEFHDPNDMWNFVSQGNTSTLNPVTPKGSGHLSRLQRDHPLPRKATYFQIVEQN